MKKYDKQPWSDSERHVLRDYYYVLGMEHLLEILPGRTPNSIRKQEVEDDEEFIYKGLSGKTFARVFKVGPNIKLDTAFKKNGLLCVELHDEVPETQKPRVVEIHDA